MRCVNPPGHLYQKVGHLASKSGLAATRQAEIRKNLEAGMAPRLNQEKRVYREILLQPQFRADICDYSGGSGDHKRITR
jgi:hypothetical protein